MWTVENRARYDRSKLRYPSDLTDEEWALALPEIPRAERGGNKRTVDVREVMNGLMYVLSTQAALEGMAARADPRLRERRQRPAGQ
jgi:transposase